MKYLQNDPDFKVKKKSRKYADIRYEKLKAWKIKNGTWID
jgi:hypothetical protein